MKRAGKQTFYQPELDSLRFFAFLLVFLHHTCASATAEMKAAGGIQRGIAILAEAGAFGVDLFFLLSAYLITEILQRERKSTDTIDVRDFYMRRILRIWPLYFSFVAFCYLIQWFTPTVFPFKALLAFVFLAGNWYCATAGFIDSPVSPLWSVSIEEQFYLLWPLVVRRLSRHGLIVVACVLPMVSSLTRWVLLSEHVDRSAIWCNTLARLDPIAVGVLAAALLYGRLPRIKRWVRLCLILGGAALLLASTWKLHVLDPAIPIADGMLGYPCGTLGALLIFLGVLGASRESLRLLTSKSIRYLGRISYGLYVFHLFSLYAVKWVLLKCLGTSPFWLRGLIAFPITVALAAASYRLLEAPFLRLKDRFTHIAHSAPGLSPGIDTP